MSFLWTRDEQGDWAAVPLSDRPLPLHSVLPPGIPPSTHISEDAPHGAPEAVFPPAASAERVAVVPAAIGLSRQYALLWGARAPVRVNGLPLTTGIRVLEDRDEIRIGERGPMFYTKETFARVETFEGSAKPTECVRCTLPIEAGARIVRCPHCCVAYHQDDDLNCWTAAPACAACGGRTDTEAGFRWTPEDAGA